MYCLQENIIKSVCYNVSFQNMNITCTLMQLKRPKFRHFLPHFIPKQENVSMEHRCPSQQTDGRTYRRTDDGLTKSFNKQETAEDSMAELQSIHIMK